MADEILAKPSPLDKLPWSLRDVVRVSAIVIIGWGVMIVGLGQISLPERMTVPNTVLLTLLFLLFYAAMVSATYWFGVRPYHLPFRELGFRRFPFWRGVGSMLGWWLVVFIVQAILTIAVLLVTGHAPSTGDATRVVDMFGTGWPALIRAVVGAVIVAPVAEETFFRGFLYPAFRNRYGVTAGIWITACIFAIVHLSLWKFFAVLIMGAVLAHLYERRGSLGPCIMLHALTNLVSVLLIYAQVGG